MIVFYKEIQIIDDEIFCDELMVRYGFIRILLILVCHRFIHACFMNKFHGVVIVMGNKGGMC
ncbi:hypothetical protein C9J12_25995 [Photobacterium frigidiphilum]|uniref:Uncharacterized protein n=1 Tax=Photobacterium frigidiphilum TaxID=264736 RepID=A0A2T3J7R0_9GAMM|nr:hypothetical protein C9J12_25995 [Photobacterium frigidiphilum]